MSKVENTSKREPMTHLGGMLGGVSGYVEGMESAGQRQLVNSTQIPTEGIADAELEALGFILKPPEGSDPLFRECELPDGWAREGSDHAMWSYIVDERGYRRIAIFYKAAFYDRRAGMHIEREPTTRAQADAWERIEPGHQWVNGNSRRDGDNYVYAWNGRYGESAPQGKHAYSDDGRRLEIVIAPDGTELDRREFTVEPIEDR